MAAHPQFRLAVCLRLSFSLLLALLPRVGAQEHAKDAPFSCEPVVPSSVVFRGFALENYEPAANEQRVRFQIEERFFGLAPDIKEYEVTLKLEDPISRGEERIVASLPGDDGQNWSAEKVDEQADKPYLEYLRKLALGKTPARILGWTSGPDDSTLAGTTVLAVGAGREYETRSNERGTFEFSEVVPGEYHVTATRAGFETLMPFQEVEVVPSGCGIVSLHFEFEGIIRGAVKNRHGAPQKGFRVDLLRIDGEDESPYDSTESDSDGVYEFRHLDPAHYRTGVSLRASQSVQSET